MTVKYTLTSHYEHIYNKDSLFGPGTTRSNYYNVYLYIVDTSLRYGRLIWSQHNQIELFCVPLYRGQLHNMDSKLWSFALHIQKGSLLIENALRLYMYIDKVYTIK